MGELSFYSGGTDGNRDGVLISEDNTNSNPFNFGTLAINQESTVQTLAFRADLGRQTQVPPVFAGDPHFNWSLDGATFAGYGASLTYNSIIGDTNKLIRLKVKALPGDSGQISPQMIIDAVQAMINIPPAPTLSAPVIAASSPAYDVLRVNTPTPAYSNIGATVTYEDYADGVLIGSSTALVRDYNILAGTYSISTIAKDIANGLQQASNTVTGVSVANPPVNQAPVISAPVVYSLGQTSVILQYTASDDVGITAHQYSLGGVYFSDGVIENIGGGQYRLTINNLVAGTPYPNVTVKVLDADGLSAIGTVSGGFTTSSAPANTAPTFSLNPRLKAGSITYNAGTYTFQVEFGLNTQSPGVLADVDGDVITVSRAYGATPYSPNDTQYVPESPFYNSSTGLWQLTLSTSAASIDFWLRLEDPTHTGINGAHASVTIPVNIAPTLSIGTPVPSLTSVQIPYTATDESGAISTLELSINAGTSFNTATSITGTYPNFTLTVTGLASNTTYTDFQLRVGDARGVKTTANVPSFTTKSSLFGLDANAKALYLFNEASGTTVVNSANQGVGDLTVYGNDTIVATSNGNGRQYADDFKTTLSSSWDDSTGSLTLPSVTGLAVNDWIIASNASQTSSGGRNYSAYKVTAINGNTLTLSASPAGGVWPSGTEIYKITAHADTGSYKAGQFGFGTGDFTAEWYGKITSPGRNQWLLGFDDVSTEADGSRTFFNLAVGVNNGIQANLWKRNSGGAVVADNSIDLTSGWQNGKSSPLVVADGAYHKIKFIRNSTQKKSYLYVDDTLCNIRDWSALYSGVAVDINANICPVIVGGCYANWGGLQFQSYSFNGVIDEVRLSNVAR